MDSTPSGSVSQHPQPVPKRHRVRTVLLRIGGIIVGLIVGWILWELLDRPFLNRLRLGLILAFAVLVIANTFLSWSSRRRETERNAILYFLLIVLITANALVLGIYSFQYEMHRPTFSITRIAKNDRERILIQRAETVPCPSQQRSETQKKGVNIMTAYAACFTGDEVVRTVREYERREREHPSDQYLQWAEYTARVGTGFPGNVPLPKRLDEGSGTVTGFFWSMAGQSMTEDECKASRGGGTVMVQMIYDGTGLLSEHRVYFDANDQPVCQALYAPQVVFS